MKIKTEHYKFFDDPLKFYNAMFTDMVKARKYIFLETYRVGYDEIGVKLRDILVDKAKEGVNVKVLIDYWGGNSLPKNFFKSLLKLGGEVRFFTKIKFNSDFFTRSHRRNHRKILVIDDEVSYLGSSNFTAYNMNWRESVLRMKGRIAHTLKDVFSQNFQLYNRYVFELPKYTQVIKADGFEILRDVPSISKQKVKKRYLDCIRQSKKKIVIETPYFLPGFKLRKALMDASRRGVDVQIIMPNNSDVSLVDILRNKYLGPMHKSGVKIAFYQQHNLHAKLMMVDDHLFSIGSSNFDYRSFRYMHEIVMIGWQKSVLYQLKKHFSYSMKNSIPFNYKKWRRRSVVNRFFEWFLLPIRHLL
ncbi:MAG: phosphatidylserine/phosphatidylglycerophosphate/cardiolipin synthase family protein [Bacteroidales bacterium]